MFIGRVATAASVLALAIGGMSSAAYAQDAEGDESQAGGLDVIVVTATKREENLQSVPVAVTAFSEELIQETGIQATEDIAVLTPSLHQLNISSPFATRLSIRGIGTAQSDPALEASVGVFVDGVFIGRTGLATSDLTDIQRIEVLQGPQGTLYGKNTNAGAISVITKRPSLTEVEGYIEGTIGNYDLRNVTLSASTPIGDTLAVRVSGNINKRDGYVENVSGPDGNSADDWNVQAKLLWAPTDRLSFLLGYTHIERDSACCMPDNTQGTAALALMASRGLPGATIPNDPYDYLVANDNVSVFKLNSDSVSMHIELETDWGSVTSITAYNEYEYRQTIDNDRSQLDIFRQAPEFNSGDSFSQELRFDAKLNDSLELLAGLFYYNQRTQSGDASLPGFSLGQDFLPIARQLLGPNIARIAAPGDALIGRGIWDSDTFAGFGQLTWHIGDNVHLTGGLRLTVEDRDADLFAKSISTAPFVVQGRAAAFVDRFAQPIDARLSRSTTNLDWLAKVVFDVAPDSIVYGSVTTGTKSGNFNGVNGTPDEREFDDEHTTSYEIGAKSTFLDNRARINAAVFYSEIKDYQFQLGLPQGGTFVSNDGKVEVSGVDVQAQFAPIDNLVLDAGVLYMHDYDIVEGPRAGEKLNSTADWTVNLGGTFTVPVGAGEAYLRADYQYMGDHDVATSNGSDPAITIQDRNLVNARLGWRNGALNLSVWAKNLTKDDYASFISPIQAFGGSRAFFLAPPRTFGATVRLDF